MKKVIFVLALFLALSALAPAAGFLTSAASAHDGPPPPTQPDPERPS